MTLVVGGEANKRPLPIDAEQLEPVSINDTFRKARRNSLVWSLVLLLVSIGSPVPRPDQSATSGEAAAIPLFPLGLAFDHWVLVALALGIAIYMFVAFRRSLHPVALMNSQRFRERGIRDVLESLSDLSAEISTVSRKRDDFLRRMDEMSSIADKFASSQIRLRTEITDVILSELKQAEHHIEAARLVRVKSLPGQAPSTQDYSQAIDDMNDRLRQSSAALEFISGEVDAKVEKLFQSLSRDKKEISTPPFEELARASEKLSNASQELTQFHSAIDALDQSYFDKFDVGATEAFFTVSLLCALYWSLDRFALWLTQI